MMILSETHDNLRQLSSKEMRAVSGGFFACGGYKMPTEEEMFGIIVSCFKGVCGEYPVGTRTDEAR